MKASVSIVRKAPTYFSGIPYFETQSFTVGQSRLSKKTSMYEARSVR